MRSLSCVVINVIQAILVLGGGLVITVGVVKFLQMAVWGQ